MMAAPRWTDSDWTEELSYIGQLARSRGSAAVPESMVCSYICSAARQAQAQGRDIIARGLYSAAAALAVAEDWPACARAVDDCASAFARAGTGRACWQCGSVAVEHNVCMVCGCALRCIDCGSDDIEPCGTCAPCASADASEWVSRSA